MIKFPKVHIAASVVNRILRVADGMAPAPPPATTTPPPSVPDTASQSLALDSALATGVPALPGIDAAPDGGATLEGEPLLNTVLTPGQ